MLSITSFLINWGYLGMFISALLAGSVLPFNSEVIIGALRGAGLNSWQLLLYATIGNVMGGMLNYWIGTFGRLDWIEKYLHVSKKKMDKAEKFMHGRGAVMAFFAFIPIIGSAITVVLGLTHANKTITLIFMTLGKFIRYALIVFGMDLFM